MVSGIHLKILACAALAGFTAGSGTQLTLHTVRESKQDLKLSGMRGGALPDGGARVEGGAGKGTGPETGQGTGHGTGQGTGPGVVRYAAYADLLRLPQTSFTAAHDSNFSRPTRLGGVSLDALLHALGEDGKGILIAALCDDLYEAHYTEEYRRLHDPVLVLRIEGRQPAEWARTGDEGSYGPYLISHAVFKPEYRALTHVEEAQIPNGVLELRFLDQATVLKAIAPVGEFAADSPQMQGYQLAFENCFRCHNQGEYGGRKARRSWNTLAAIAGSDPASFRAYVKNPQAVDAKAQMPGNPDYDRATLDALTAYFRTFAGGE